jgi:recombination protein RecA
MAKAKAQSQKLTSFESLKSHFAKSYGQDAIRFPGDKTVVDVEVVPTMIASIDKGIGCGGIPRGRIIEIFGPESSGKTTTCLSIAAAFQKHLFDGNQGVVAYIDVEHALDPTWATKIGCDIENMIFTQPEHAEQAYDMAEALAKSGLVQLIVIDSIAAMAPKSEIEGTLEDNNSIGEQARINSKALRKLKGAMHQNNCTMLCVNQIREKIGVMFGSNETTPGGRALKFYSTIRMDIRRSSTLKIGDVQVGNETKVKFVKNKVAPPFTEALFNIAFGKDEYPVYGIDPYAGLLSVAEECKVITKNGSFYKYGDITLGNGTTQASMFLMADQNLFKEIYDKLPLRKKKCQSETQSINQEASSISESLPQQDS